MRISDWSSDVCSSDLEAAAQILPQVDLAISRQENALSVLTGRAPAAIRPRAKLSGLQAPPLPGGLPSTLLRRRPDIAQAELSLAASDATLDARSEEHTSELQSLMRISYAVFCLKKKNKQITTKQTP